MFAVSSRRFLFICLILVVFLMYFHTHGFNPHDEGWFIQAALRAYHGETPYLHFSFLYNPGGIYANLVGFHLFGPSLFSSRLVALVNSFICLFFIYRVVKSTHITSAVNYLLLFCFLFWGPGHINFVWPVMLCITAGLASGLLLQSQNISEKPFLIYLSGVFSALTFIFKQNFGVAVFITCLAYFFINPHLKHVRLFIIHALGFLSVLAIFILHLILTGSFFPYLQEVVVFTYQKLILSGILNSPYPWQFPAPIHFRIIKTLFYFSPLLISVFSLYRLIKIKNFSLTYFPLLSLTYYLLSIRPTTDYIHLAPLIALSSISLCLSSELSAKKIRIGIITSLLLLTLFGFYSAVFKNYYRWEPSLSSQNTPLPAPNHFIFVSKSDAENIHRLNNFFAALPDRPKHIFVYNFAPEFYLLLAKKNPTRYDYIHSGVATPLVQMGIITTLKSYPVNYVLTNIDLATDTTDLSHFIQSNYHSAYRVNQYTVWSLQKTFLQE